MAINPNNRHDLRNATDDELIAAAKEYRETLAAFGLRLYGFDPTIGVMDANGNSASLTSDMYEGMLKVKNDLATARELLRACVPIIDHAQRLNADDDEPCEVFRHACQNRLASIAKFLNG